MNLTRVSVLLAIFVVVCAASSALAAGQVCFEVTDYPIRPQALAVGVGDFNRDGDLDLAVATGSWSDPSTPGLVSILLGSGDGTFSTGLDYAAGIRPHGLVVADLNEDGILDLAIANYGHDYQGSVVTILLGNGDGTFRGPLQYSAGTNLIFVMTGDFNADGHVDLAVGNNNWPQGVTILQGAGDGSFRATGHYYLVGVNPRGGEVGDFNGDGSLDLAVGVYQWPSGVEILFGVGNGTFRPPVHYDVPGNVQSVRGGDFNGDGVTDLVTTNVHGADVSILLGERDGSFSLYANYAVLQTPIGAAVADFDQDGRIDLAVTSNAVPYLSLLLGHGDGSFDNSVSYRVADVSIDGNPIVAADFDEDGRLDLAVTGCYAGIVSVLLNVCAQFSAFNLQHVELDFGTQASADAYKLAGGFTPAAGRHVDLLRDEVAVTVGPLKMTIPAGSFVAQGSGFTWTGKIGNATMTAAFVDLGAGVFGFGIEARAVDLGGVTNPVPIRLSIGRDWGEATLRVPGRLVLDQGMTVPGGLVPGTPVPVQRGR